MLEQAARKEAVVERLDDDTVERLLLAAVPDAHRVATWILRDQLAAEDAVNEAVASAWNRRRSIRSAETVAGWFARIVVNECRDELRRRRRQPRIASIDSEPEEADPATIVDRHSHEYDDLAAAIARLTDDERLVLGLRFGRDLTVPQIATVTGIREGTIKSRLHHALEHLRASLDAERRAERRAEEMAVTPSREARR